VTSAYGAVYTITFIVGAFCWAMNDGPKITPLLDRGSNMFGRMILLGFIGIVLRHYHIL